MRNKATDIFLAGLLISLFLCLSSCGRDKSGPTYVCIQAGGTWNVALDYGNGLQGQQMWTIVQTGCDLTLTGTPPDLYGPTLPDGTAGGYSFDSGLSAAWVNTWDTCRYYSNLDGTIISSMLTGTIYWTRSAYGAGYCSSSMGQIAVTGSR